MHEGRRNRNLEIWFRNWRGKHQKIVDVKPTRKIERLPKTLCSSLKIAPIRWEEAPEGLIIPVWEGGGQIVSKAYSRRLHLSRNLYRLRTPRELGWQKAFDLMALTGETGQLAERVYEALGKETIIKMLDEVLFPSIPRLVYLMSESKLKNKVIAEKTRSPRVNAFYRS